MLADEVDYVIGVDTHRDQHVLAVLAEKAAEAGAVVAGALDRPNAHASSVTFRKSQRVTEAAQVGMHRLLGHQCARRRGHDRKRVLVAVGVDPDHVVHLLCKHPD